ncbi:MAG TPA: permease [Acidimicrobiia bacterium]
MGVLEDVGRSLREGFFMFWETLWPLILGFALSGAVQAFVSRDQMERVMGDHRPRTVTRASAIGMASSSCSYAATAMAKSLFEKGADFTTALIFMFASTNLVLELGIVLVVLLGWQFALAEFVGGPIMIALLALTGSFVVGKSIAARARRNLRAAREADDPDAMAGVSEERQAELEREPWRKKLRSRAAWSDAATYTVADLTMLRRELAVGYLVAGFLTVLVPVQVWNDVFIHGHGWWTSVENVVVGPFVAIISFVCSIGNVPLAAALWHGGISFGGVIAFIFADLITFPLLLIYRRYYGWRVTLRLLLWFWAVMAVAGLAVEGLFDVTGLIPRTRPRDIVPTTFQWNYTTFLNLAFLVVAGYLYWLYRNRDRFGGGAGYAIDPVCGMQVQTANAPASTHHDGRSYWFCSDRCADQFRRDPDVHTPAAGPVSNPAPGPS